MAAELAAVGASQPGPAVVLTADSLADPRVAAGDREPELLAEEGELVALDDDDTAQLGEAEGLLGGIDRDPEGLLLQELMGRQGRAQEGRPEGDRGDGREPEVPRQLLARAVGGRGEEPGAERFAGPRR